MCREKTKSKKVVTHNALVEFQGYKDLDGLASRVSFFLYDVIDMSMENNT